jgi:hypothetical protein
MLTEAANERNLFAQENLQRESFRMQQEAQNARRENAIIETFGYVALQDSEELGIKRGQFIGRDVVGVERRLPDPTEIGIELQRRIQNNIPTMLDPSLFSIPGLDNMLKRLQGSSAGVGGMGPRWGSDPEFPNGSYIRLETNDKGEQEEKLVVVPGTKPGQGDKGAASLANINFIMDTMGPDMTTIMNDFKSGNVGPGSTYRVFTSMIQPHLANAYTEALRTGAKDANGNIVIKNPIDLFDISNRIKGQKEQKFFLEELLPQVLLGFTKSEILEMAGIPQDAMQDIVEFENLVVLPNPDKFSNIVTDQTADGKKGIKPEIKKKLVEIQEFSGLSLTRLSALINDAKDPLAALNQMIEKREIIRAGVVQSSSTISVTQTARDVVQDTVTKNKYNVEEGIAFVRATIEDNPAAKPARIVQSGTTGQIAPVYDNRITKYGFDSKDARAMSDASRRAKLIADRMLELRSSGLGGVGLISLVTNLVGGARDIADALTKLATQYNMEPDVAAKFQERAELLKQAGSLKDQQIDMDTVIGGQKVFDLLGEQLAFAMAAAVQGGEGGRAISDRDVEAQRAVLGLRGILASNTGVEQNLRYISQEMKRAAVINDQYAKSIDEEDFQAVYIYDQSITRARTIDELTSGAPVLPSEDARVQDQEMILIDGVLTPVAR